MSHRLTHHRLFALRLSVTTIVAGLCVTALSVLPASALLNTYSIRSGTALYIPGNTSLLDRSVPHDDEIVDVNLPFPVTLYGTQYRVAHVSTNGNVQFGALATSAYANQCFPTAVFYAGPVVATYWDDLLIRAYPAPDALNTRLKGTAPHRTFAISWRGVEAATGLTAVRAELVFHEGSRNFAMIYADGGGRSATIGVQQSPTGPATQYACNAGHGVVLPGQKLTYVYH